MEVNTPPATLAEFATAHPEVTLDLRAWVQDGRGGTWVQGSTEAGLLAEIAAALDSWP